MESEKNSCFLLNSLWFSRILTFYFSYQEEYKVQKLVGMVRRCVEDYEMIRPGDRVAVGVSGGKDSLALLVFLSELKKYPQMNFDLEAVTIDMGMGMDYSGVQSLCDRLEIPYTIVPTQIGPIIFDYRKEQNPCSMCAKMRRVQQVGIYILN